MIKMFNDLHAYKDIDTDKRDNIMALAVRGGAVT